MKDGALPDLKVWARQFPEIVGQAFTIRGVEVTIKGSLVEERGRFVLRVSGSNSVICLGPLEHKVQWDPGRKREEPLTNEEQQAYQRLIDRMAKSGDRSHKIRVTGPLQQRERGAPPILTIRDFTWD